MRFWDSSAIVPLLAEQSATVQSEAWFTADPQMVVWTLSETEIRSALWRLVRDSVLQEEQALACEKMADTVLATAHTVPNIGDVKRHARRLLRAHPLRAADAMQLAAGLSWADGNTDGKFFLAFDVKLRLAARREGFEVE